MNDQPEPATDQTDKVKRSGKSCIWVLAIVGLAGLAVGSLAVGIIYWLYVSYTPEVDESLIKKSDIAKDDDPQNKPKNSITDWLIDHPVKEAEYPLDPIIRVAENGLEYIDQNLKDYTATIEKQELVKGELLDKQYIQCKIRNPSAEKPFAVYLKFVGPESLANTESIYVEGENDGKLIGHDGRELFKHITFRVKPTGFIPMTGNRYPITEIGLRNLVARMLERTKADRKNKEIQITIDRNIVFNGHSATLIRLCNPEQKPGLDYYQADVYIDDELNIPVSYAAYLWPEKPGGERRVLESYAYNDIKVNVGLTDDDFDPANPEYDFNVKK